MTQMTQDIAKALSDIVGRASDNMQQKDSGVWGPPSPGQTWDEYEQIAQQIQPSSSITAPPKYQQINEVRELIPKQNSSSRIKRKQESEEEVEGEESPKSDLQVAFEKEQQDKIDSTYDFMEVMAASNPSYNPSDPIFQNMNESINEEREDAKNSLDAKAANSEYNRRFLDENGEMLNPIDWGLLSFTGQQKTSNAARDIYDDIANRERKNLAGLVEGSDYDNTKSRIVGENQDQNLIDDGRDSSREALYMTGEQYLKYKDAGLPGRDDSKIDPNEIYNKQAEMDDYGFIPYLVSDDGMVKFHDQASMEAVNSFWNNLTNARRNATDYTYIVDGQELSGKDVQANGALWANRFAEQMQNKDNYTVRDRSLASEDAVPLITSYTLEMADGNKETIEGQDPTSAIQYPDGTIVVGFPDGTEWYFDDMNDFNSSFITNEARVAGDDELDKANVWRNFDPLVLDDGTKIRADLAKDLLDKEETYEQNGISVDYGPLNWGKPVAENPFTDGFAPWIADITLGSAPLFYLPAAATQAIGNAYTNSLGMKAGSDDYLNNTYSMLSDNPTKEEIITSTIGSLGLPITEHLFGNIGGNLGGQVLSKIIGKTAANLKPAVRYGLGTLGEAVEEVPGNAWEEFQANGITDWYANDAEDDEGYPIIDDQGRVQKVDTDIRDRLGNFIADAPLAMLGGGILGAGLGWTSLPGYSKEYQTRKLLEELGYDDFKKVRPSQVIIDLTDEERDFYNS